MCCRMIVAFLVLCVVAHDAVAGRLGLHVTDAELTIWQDRRVNGYPSDAQFGGFITTEWSVILSNANTFSSNPTSTSYVYKGNQLNTAWDDQAVDAGTQSPNTCPGRTRGKYPRDAGFVYLLTGTASYASAYRSFILAQIAESGMNMTNRTKWPLPTSPGSIWWFNCTWEIAIFLNETLFGYDYVLAGNTKYGHTTFSTSEKTSIKTFYENTLEYINALATSRVYGYFPNRDSDNYTTAGGYPGAVKGLTHFGGYTTYNVQDTLANLPGLMNSSVCNIAVVFGNATYIAKAKRLFTEWLTYNTASDGTVYDQYRWSTVSSNQMQNAYHYAQAGIASYMMCADHLARDGDTSLYDLSTSTGISGWTGGAKTLETAMQRLAQIGLGERELSGGVDVYGTTSSGEQDQAHEIGPGTTFISEISLIPGNLYYQNTHVTNMAYRAGQPANGGTGGYDNRGGVWGEYPSVRFMFGKQEGVVDPYTGSPTANNPQVTAVFVEKARPNVVGVILSNPNAGTISGTVGFTVKRNGSSNAITTYNCGTLIQGQPGCYLTVTTAYSSPSDTLSVSYSPAAGNVTDGTQEVASVTDFAGNNYTNILFTPYNYTSVSCQDAGRTLASMFTGDGTTETQSWVCSNTTTGNFIVNLGASKALDSITYIGDALGNLTCTTFNLDKDETCVGSWTNVVLNQPCNDNIQHTVLLGPDTARCWRVIVTGPAAGIQMRRLTGELSGEQPPTSPTGALGIAILGGTAWQGGMSFAH